MKYTRRCFINSDFLVKWNVLWRQEGYFYLNLFKLYVLCGKASQLQPHVLFQESHELRTSNKSHFRFYNASTVLGLGTEYTKEATLPLPFVRCLTGWWASCQVHIRRDAGATMLTIVVPIKLGKYELGFILTIAVLPFTQNARGRKCWWGSRVKERRK